MPQKFKMMSPPNRETLRCAAVALVALFPVLSTHAAKPNIIHIVGDDIGSNDFNFSRGTNP